MKTILALAGMTVGGWLGWVVGALVSTMAAYILSIVGSAVGLYWINRFRGHYLS